MWFQRGEDAALLAEMPSTDARRRLPTLAWVIGAVALLAALFVGVLVHQARARRATAPSLAGQPAAPASGAAGALAARSRPQMTPITSAARRDVRPTARVPAEVLAGEKLLRRGHAASALARFQRTLVRDADHVRALRGACLSLARLGRLQDAARVCRRAIERAPGDLETRRALAAIYYDGGAYKWSAAEWRRVVRKAPHDVHARRALRAAEARAGKG